MTHPTRLKVDFSREENMSILWTDMAPGD